MILEFLWPYLAGAAAIVGSLLIAFIKGGERARRQRDLRDAKANEAAHERANNANLGESLTDDERAERLRQLGTKLGN